MKGTWTFNKKRSRLLAGFMAFVLVFSNIAANVQTVYATGIATQSNGTMLPFPGQNDDDTAEPDPAQETEPEETAAAEDEYDLLVNILPKAETDTETGKAVWNGRWDAYDYSELGQTLLQDSEYSALAGELTGTWSSDDTDVLAMHSNGDARVKAPGYAAVTFTYEAPKAEPEVAAEAAEVPADPTVTDAAQPENEAAADDASTVDEGEAAEDEVVVDDGDVVDEGEVTGDEVVVGGEVTGEVTADGEEVADEAGQSENEDDAAVDAVSEDQPAADENADNEPAADASVEEVVDEATPSNSDKVEEPSVDVEENAAPSETVTDPEPLPAVPTNEQNALEPEEEYPMADGTELSWVVKVESDRVTMYSDAPYNDLMELAVEAGCEWAGFGSSRVEEFGLPTDGIWKSLDEDVVFLTADGDMTIMVDDGVCQIAYSYTENGELYVALWDVKVGVGIALMDRSRVFMRDLKFDNGETLHIISLKSGNIAAYCVEHGAHLENKNYDWSIVTVTEDDLKNDFQKRLIGTILAYGGYTGTDQPAQTWSSNTTKQYAGTQLLIWEALASYRDENFIRTNDEFANYLNDDHDDYYDSIAKNVQKELLRPSFCTNGAAPSIWEYENGKYVARFTDVNNVISKWPTDRITISGIPTGVTIQIEVINNQLVLTADNPPYNESSKEATITLKKNVSAKTFDWYSKSNIQDVIVVKGDASYEISATAKVIAPAAPKISVTLEKKDGDTNQAIQGAVFGLSRSKKDQDNWSVYMSGLVTGNNYTAERTSGASGIAGKITVSELDPAYKYRFVETAAAPHYKFEALESDVITPVDGTEEYTVSLTNKKLISVTLEKKDSNNENQLISGATFKLQRRIGNDAWSDYRSGLITGNNYTAESTSSASGTAGKITVSDLDPAYKYRFVETAAAPRYKFEAVVSEEIVPQNGNYNYTVSLTNKHLVNVTLIKKEVGNDQVLQGAVFDLERSKDGNSWEKVPEKTNLTTNAQGKIEITDLDPDYKYRFVETKAPDGYKIVGDGTSSEVTINCATNSGEVTVYNKKLVHVTLIKKDQNEQPLNGATFTLERAENGTENWEEFWAGLQTGKSYVYDMYAGGGPAFGEGGTPETGKITVDGLDPDYQYRFKETDSPDSNYKFDNDNGNFYPVGHNGEVTATNEYKIGLLDISKAITGYKDGVNFLFTITLTMPDYLQNKEKAAEEITTSGTNTKKVSDEGKTVTITGNLGGGNEITIGNVPLQSRYAIKEETLFTDTDNEEILYTPVKLTVNGTPYIPTEISSEFGFTGYLTKEGVTVTVAATNEGYKSTKEQFHVSKSFIQYVNNEETGTEAPKEGVFTFNLYELDAKGKKTTEDPIDTVTIDAAATADWKADFQERTYDQDTMGETFWYMIEEDLGENRNTYTKSTPVYVQVKVDENDTDGDGIVDTTVTYHDSWKSEAVKSIAEFTNREYKVQLNFNKEFDVLVDNESQGSGSHEDESIHFDFYSVTEDAEGQQVLTKLGEQDVTVDSEGKWAGDFEQTYARTGDNNAGGIYWYLIREDLGGDEKLYTPSGEIYARVTVTDSGAEEMYSTVEYFRTYKGDKADRLTPVRVVNRQYSATLHAAKAFDRMLNNKSETAEKEGTFTFELYEWDGSRTENKWGTEPIDKKEVSAETEWAAEFERQYYYYAADNNNIGTHWYKIQEHMTDEQERTYANSGPVYASVTVERKGNDGELGTTVQYYREFDEATGSGMYALAFTVVDGKLVSGAEQSRITNTRNEIDVELFKQFAKVVDGETVEETDEEKAAHDSETYKFDLKKYRDDGTWGPAETNEKGEPVELTGEASRDNDWKVSFRLHYSENDRPKEGGSRVYWYQIVENLSEEQKETYVGSKLYARVEITDDNSDGKYEVETKYYTSVMPNMTAGHSDGDVLTGLGELESGRVNITNTAEYTSFEFYKQVDHVLNNDSETDVDKQDGEKFNFELSKWENGWQPTGKTATADAASGWTASFEMNYAKEANDTAVVPLTYWYRISEAGQDEKYTAHPVYVKVDIDKVNGLHTAVSYYKDFDTENGTGLRPFGEGEKISFRNVENQATLDLYKKVTRVTDGTSEDYNDQSDDSFEFELHSGAVEDGEIVWTSMNRKSTASRDSRWEAGFTLNYNADDAAEDAREGSSTYWYMIRENQTDVQEKDYVNDGPVYAAVTVTRKAEDINDITTQVVYYKEVSVGSDGQITGSSAFDSNIPTYENVMYRVTLKPDVIKTVIGYDGQALEKPDATFTFQLYEKVGGDYVLLRSAQNDADGKVDFEPLVYTGADEGTHTYRMLEVAEGGDYRYDTTVYDFTVEVGPSHSSELQAVPSYDMGEPFEFTNDKIFTEDDQWTPRATKTLNGQLAGADGFTFELKDEAGNVVSTATSAGNGSVTFDTITYGEGEDGVHTYTMNERVGSSGLIIYDAKVYTVTVTVEKTAAGNRVASVAYTLDGAAVTDVLFENQTRSTTSTTPNRTGTTIPDNEVPQGPGTPEIITISDEPTPLSDFETIEDEDVPLAFLAPMTGDNRPVGAAALFGLLALGMMGAFGILASKKDEEDA